MYHNAMIESFLTTGIGSLPFKEPVEACEFIFNAVDMPFWPQLPKKSFYELMIPQYSEGFPFIKFSKDKIWAEKSSGSLTESFYESVGRGETFPISPGYASGLYAFLNLLQEKEKKLHTVKGHITGPITFTLGLTDKNRRPIYFDEELRELALELLKGKVRWQIEKLNLFAEKIVIFIDEPVMSALGTSTYVGVDDKEVLRILSTIVHTIQEAKAIAGMHCCSKADWELIVESGIDILNFDAFDYADSLHLYPGAVNDFLERGGLIAWGIVPTSEKIRTVDVRELMNRLENEIVILNQMGISEDMVRRQSLLTPACGTGSMKIEDNKMVFTLLKALRDQYRN